ncbi:hypothetical protein D3C86_1879690 [compost metagenome]
MVITEMSLYSDGGDKYEGKQDGPPPVPAEPSAIPAIVMESQYGGAILSGSCGRPFYRCRDCWRRDYRDYDCLSADPGGV